LKNKDFLGGFMGILSFPTTATSFVGRNAELAEIVRLLSDPACRLLTLVGPGGIGKTRLAIEAARRLSVGEGFKPSSTYPHSVYFVAFQPLTSPDFMVSTIADALGFQFYAGAEPKRQLLDYLRAKDCLLVLDNLEHLLDGITLLSDILDAARGVRILATSRERLNLREEWVLEVGGLSYPAAEFETDIKHYAAVELFVEHARRANVRFQLTDEQKPFVIRICGLVGGMPLGIELAAAWVRALSCEQIASEIAHSLDILETSTRNVEPRHHTMRAAFEPTWERLSTGERDVFKRLSVFRGGFTREAAEQVAGASLRTLTALVDKSLLRVSEQGRYDLHELLRQYSEEKLRELPSEYEQILDRHCTYYADFMGQWADDPIRITENEVRESIVKEIDNVRVAFRRAVERHMLNEMTQFMPTLLHFYDLHDRYQEGVEACRLVAEGVSKIGIERNEQQQRVFGLARAWHAWFLQHLFQIDEARALAQSSLDLLLPLPNGREIVYTYIFLCQLTPNSMEMKYAAEEALKRARTLNFQWGIVVGLDQLSWAARELKEYEQALRLLEEALSLNRKGTHKWAWGETWTLMHLSWVAYDQQNFIQSKRYSLEGLAIAETIGNRFAMCVHLKALGGLSFFNGNNPEAMLYYHRSLVLAQELGNRIHIILAHNELGRVAAHLGNGYEAREHFHEALQMILENPDEAWMLTTLAGTADLMAAESKAERAVELLVHPLQHPRTSADDRRWAERLRRELETTLAPEVYAAAWERGMKLEVSALAAELLAEFSQPTQTVALKITTPIALSGVEALTERELEILHLLADGLNSREVAQRLYLGVGTIRWYLRQIYSKLDAHSRSQAIARARELHLLI
jgi:predicted ATPase/DNA-binding CsgD family transcriptional regulator